MVKVIVCLSGFSGAGKSLVSRTLRKKFGFKSFKIGRHLELSAKEKGVNFSEFVSKLHSNSSTGAIQELHFKMSKFLNNSSGLIVEGINTVGELNQLRDFFPKSTVLSCFIDVPLDIRIKRVAQRQKLSVSKARDYVLSREKDRKEKGMNKMLLNADFVVLNDGLGVNELITKVEKGMKNEIKSRLIKLLKSRKKSMVLRKRHKLK